MITTDDIRAAHARIAGHIRRTPTMPLSAATFGTPVPVAMKLEFLQVTGTFKARGAFNTLLGGTMPKAGVCAASGGNHGIAVAHAAATLGIPARIFVPEISSPAKIARIRETGAGLVVGGAHDAWPTIAGQGTVGLEWEEDAGGLDTVLVAVGGGGLISGIARWFERRVKVVGVEPEGSRALQAALAAGGPVDVEVDSIAADSLGARNVFGRVHETAARYVDSVVLVSDDAIRDAQRRLWLGLRAASEPGGAAALAALVSGAYRPEPGERVGVLACGANVDLARLAEVVGGA
ncbi:MAG: threonine dehydratase [Xanthobacteraceae bacterium]|nr:MAG: threonine dehydratase [Xanthobacteraceae bacterium]